MTNINYNDENFLIIQRKIEECNKEILDSLNNIYNEVSDIDTVLNTPKANEIIPVYNDYIKDKIEYLNEKSDEYKNNFNYIISSYETYYNDVKEMTVIEDD